MSYVQYLEEAQYDTESEYQNILRQEAYDPEDYWYCEEHDQELPLGTACTACPEEEVAYYLPDIQAEDNLPF